MTAFAPLYMFIASLSCAESNDSWAVSLCGNGAACHVNEGYADDSVEFGEHGEDDGVTEEVAVALGNAGDTVGTNLTLTDAGEEASEAASQTSTEDGGSLNSCGFRSEQVEHVLAHVETSEAIQTLCAGESRQHEGVTEELAVLLQAADSSITSDGYSVGAADAGQTYHDCYANVGDEECCVHN